MDLNGQEPLSSLVLEHEHYANPRTFTGLTETDIAQMADSIAAGRSEACPSGIEVPLLVVKVKGEDGSIKNVVFDGQRRTLGAREVFKKKPDTLIPVKYMTEGPVELDWKIADDLLLRALKVGIQRRDLSSYELSEVCERLRNRDTKTLAAIGDAIGKSESWVSRILSARKKAAPETLKAWRENKLTEEQFRDISTKTTAAEQPELVAETKRLKEEGGREARSEARNVVREKTGKKAQTKHEGSAAPATERKAPAKAELEALVAMGESKTPTDAYVKGVFEGVRYALGLSHPDHFARPWGVYMARVQGTPKPKAKKAAKKKGKK